MDKVESYSLLFTDTLVSNLAINVNEELVLSSMKLFGTYNNLIIIPVITTAFLIASSFNYLLGRLLFNILNAPSDPSNKLRYANFVKIIFRYKIIILLLVVAPFYGKLISVLVGFCRLGFTKTLAILGFAKFCYYSISLLL